MGGRVGQLEVSESEQTLNDINGVQLELHPPPPSPEKDEMSLISMVLTNRISHLENALQSG